MSPILSSKASMSAQAYGLLGVTAVPYSPTGAYDALATVTVPSGGQASITFSGIPNTYTHLQIRATARTNRASASDQFKLQVNGDTSSNYSIHSVYGNGSSAVSEGYSGQTNWNTFDTLPAASASSNVFGEVIVDVLDYASTTKNKTMRALGGFDNNGNGNIILSSSAWYSTSAITSLNIIAIGSFTQYSTFSLYGVK